MANTNSYAAKMALKRQLSMSEGLVADRFPGISAMVIHMTYYQKGANPVLMTRTVNILPSSYACFKMDCMIKGCDGGGFDLTSIVAGLVKARKQKCKGSLNCHGSSDSISSGHARIDYEIALKYK